MNIEKPPPARSLHPAWGALLLVCAGVAAYLPVVHAGFIWDDDASLTSNALIRASDGLSRFWFSTQPADYWPVSSTTLWLEWRLWGMQAAGYHCTNLALHLGEALLLWAILRRLRLPGAYLAALLFTVHPVNVESVAWIAQRKNLMAMLLYLASIYWFLNTHHALPTPVVRRSSQSEGGSRAASSSTNPYYALSLLAFILALLSKGSVAPLPVVLAGLILWRRKLTRGDLIRLAPFLAVAAVLGAVNIWFQSHGLGDVVRSTGLLPRVLGAAAAVWFYLGKTLAPYPLILVYPQWHVRAADPVWWVPLLAAVAATVVLWRCRRTWSRPWLFAWAYFCVMLAPALGLTDVTFMQYSPVADHYQHLAIIGILALAGASWARWRSPAVAAVLVCALAALTYRQCQMYRDSDTLYRTMLRQDPHSWLASNNLGIALDRAGRTQDAMKFYEQALRFNPEFDGAHYNLGRLLAQQGSFAEAARHFAEAVRIKPHFFNARLNLASALLQTGDLPDAIARYREALQLDPESAVAHDYLGVALARGGRMPEAVSEFATAVRLQPDFSEAHQNLGNALRAAGRTAEAQAQYDLVGRPGGPSSQPAGGTEKR